MDQDSFQSELTALSLLHFLGPECDKARENHQNLNLKSVLQFLALFKDP